MCDSFGGEHFGDVAYKIGANVFQNFDLGFLKFSHVVAMDVGNLKLEGLGIVEDKGEEEKK